MTRSEASGESQTITSLEAEYEIDRRVTVYESVLRDYRGRVVDLCAAAGIPPMSPRQTVACIAAEKRVGHGQGMVFAGQALGAP